MPRPLLALCFASACLAAWLGASAAAANGRFPSSQLLVKHPSDPNRLWMRATYGVLTSADRGCTWHRICEGAPNYSGSEDPMFGVLADGTVIGGLFKGLSTTRDHGCNWSLDGPMQSQYVVDLAVLPTDPARAVAMVGSGRNDGTFTNQVWRTTDSARTWTKLGADIDPELLLLTLDAAPSAPSRIYVTAVRTTRTDAGDRRQGVLLRSDDDGATWSTRVITGSTGALEPWLSAVHPNDPDKLYVRLRGPDSSPDFVDNRVVYSPDGGATWSQIFDARADILGFALSPDGSRIVLGLGDSHDLDRARPVDPAVLGVYAASTADHEFTRTRWSQIGCLTWAAEGLYVCATEYAFDGGGPGFELGLSTDEGATVKQVMHLSGIEGMLECPSNSTLAQACTDSEWRQVCLDLGRCTYDGGGYVPYPRGETCSAGTGGTGPDGGAGSGGSAGDAGSGGTGTTADASAGASNLVASGVEARGGCGCRTPAPNPSLAAALFVAAAAVPLALRRKRRFSARAAPGSRPRPRRPG